MTKRIINNCVMIKAGIKKGLGAPNNENGKCVGYASFDGDEPCLVCKACEFNTTFEEDDI